MNKETVYSYSDFSVQYTVTKSWGLLLNKVLNSMWIIWSCYKQKSPYKYRLKFLHITSVVLTCVGISERKKKVKVLQAGKYKAKYK